jgi:hypothetical protein
MDLTTRRSATSAYRDPCADLFQGQEQTIQGEPRLGSERLQFALRGTGFRYHHRHARKVRQSGL